MLGRGRQHPGRGKAGAGTGIAALEDRDCKPAPPITPAPTTATSTAAGTGPVVAAALAATAAPAAPCGAGRPNSVAGETACIKISTLRVEIRKLWWVRSPIPTPVRAGSGSKDFRAANGQRFLSPLSGISLERELCNAPAPAGSRGWKYAGRVAFPCRVFCLRTFSVCASSANSLTFTSMKAENRRDPHPKPFICLYGI
jgi:hypothetical protein